MFNRVRFVAHYREGGAVVRRESMMMAVIIMFAVSGYVNYEDVPVVDVFRKPVR
jgi:hypothetical protein